MHSPATGPGEVAGVLQEAGFKRGRSSQVNGTTASWEGPPPAGRNPRVQSQVWD